MKKNENKKIFVDKIKPILRRSRFSQINMDDMARYMDISKVTLYKYFSSKDEIIEMHVDHCIEYLINADEQLLNEELSFEARFRMMYEQTIKCVVYMPDILIRDLLEVYSVLAEKLLAAEQIRHKNLHRFYQSGMDKQVFNGINTMLSIVQDDLMLRRIFEPSFSIQYDMTLKQGIIDFYLLKKLQLFKPEFLHTVNDMEMENQIRDIIQKISW